MNWFALKGQPSSWISVAPSSKSRGTWHTFVHITLQSLEVFHLPKSAISQMVSGQRQTSPTKLCREVFTVYGNYVEFKVNGTSLFIIFFKVHSFESSNHLKHKGMLCIFE